MKGFLKILCLLFCLCFFACSKKETLKKPTSNDFESLMGKDLPAWTHVQTKEDFDNLSFFKSLYEKNLSFLAQPLSENRIPKVVHYIWIGPKPFPRESIENVRTWIAKHPDWKFKFWTDRERPLPHPAMEAHLLKDFQFEKLEHCFNDSDNYGEKSDVLRYEILYREGGVYVDHDVKCFKSFTPLNQAYDLYCGMEVPYPTSLSSSVLPTNNIIGARAGHPVLKEAMDWLNGHWEQINKDYPGKDKDAVINRVAHRTFLVLGEMMKKFANQSGNRDVALPSYYFNAPKEEWAIFAQHKYAGTWFENETRFEKLVRERLMYLSKKTNRALLFIGLLSCINVLGFVILLTLFLKKRRATQQS